MHKMPKYSRPMLVFNSSFCWHGNGAILWSCLKQVKAHAAGMFWLSGGLLTLLVLSWEFVCFEMSKHYQKTQWLPCIFGITFIWACGSCGIQTLACASSPGVARLTDTPIATQSILASGGQRWTDCTGKGAFIQIWKITIQTDCKHLTNTECSTGCDTNRL